MLPRPESVEKSTTKTASRSHDTMGPGHEIKKRRKKLKRSAGAETAARRLAIGAGKRWRRRQHRRRSHAAAPVRRGRALISLLQHLAKHNALHRALENAAEDIVDRCFVTESRAGIIIAALAKFRSCLLDFDAPCRDLANLSPHPRDFLVSAGDRLREPIDLFDDGAVFVRLRSRGLTIERPHIIARIVLRHEFDRLGESTLVVLPGDCIILTVERLQLSARLRNVNWSIAHL